jgi:hypothetical protein
VTPDYLIWPRLLQLRTCLCDALTDRGLYADICICTILVGGQADSSYVTNGKAMAWVRLTTAYPSDSLPSQSNSLTKCGGPMAAVVELGVLRCATVGQRDALTQVQQEEMAEWAAADLGAMIAATCCFNGDMIVGQYVPLADGATFGGALTVTVAQAD